MERRKFLKTGSAGLGVLAFAGAVSAIPVAEPKKWAIVYGSKCGSTKDYANAINEGLGGVADVIDIATSTPQVDDYEFFIIGGWRNANSVEPAAIPSFIASNKSALKDKIKGVFVVVGNGGNATLSSAITNFLNQKLVDPAGVDSSVGKVFFGKSDPNCNGLGFTYDNVKREDGVAFGKKIAGETLALPHATKGGSPVLGLHQKKGGVLGGRQIVAYTLPVAGEVTLAVCTMSGKVLTTLVSGHRSAGYYEVPWSVGMVPSGFYVYHLKVGTYSETCTATAAVR